jgi:hypothetical protein
MIDSSPELKTVLEQDTTLSINSGCTIEYNLNSLVDNITLSGAEISRIDSAGNFYQPFKKLFPIDSIVKPVRPTKAGIKYAIVGDVQNLLHIRLIIEHIILELRLLINIMYQIKTLV